MSANSKKPEKSFKRKVFIVSSILSTVLIIVALGLFYVFFGPTKYPAGDGDYPLGDKLEYIGKEDYGCRGFCDSKPGSVLYYATDMNEEELKKYFSKASYKKTNTGGGSGASYTFEHLTFFHKDAAVFTLSFYDNKSVLEKGNFKNTNKKHVLSLGYSGYQKALESL